MQTNSLFHMAAIRLTSIVIEAQKRLILNPYDVAHDVAHHNRVFEWSMKIVETEGLVVDQTFLTVAAWMHDLEDRRGEKTKVIRQILKDCGCGEIFINKVIFLIKEHSFGKKQTAQESKILYDADKLEYVDPRRLGAFIQAAKDGLLDEKTFLRYKKQWKQRVYKIPATLHFPFSKKQFAAMLPGAEKIMTEI